MAYFQPFIFFVLAAFPFLFISPSHSSLDHDDVEIFPPANQVGNVTLSLYYETLCPGCASFITNDLVKVFQTDLYTIVNLSMEKMNAIDSCVIHLWPDVKTHFAFVRCTEEQRLKEEPVGSKEAMWKNCSDQLGLRGDMINKCYATGIGTKLLLQYGKETASLNPPHEYVPWVVVNNQPLKDDYENFVKYVCDAYQGDPKPEACNTQSSSVGSTNRKIATKIHPGCYAEQS
ncbi:putative Gamma-interferon-inducible lysosomal thiol reductase precursor [Hibiscus syriacus]|uniref:Gamma-interferon-inducible lysosomal thiol reductase n=1 Tax=Hibiscus syriacus TaxID=106335 RepID=A0A6A2Z5R4_HIBSY|nr:putative Gamma-interferon-inducible lysosomal thiol reductase precursor [Hibiscus syriacus]